MKMYEIKVTKEALEQLVKMAKQYIKSAEYIMNNRTLQYSDEELNEMWIKKDYLQMFIDEIEEMPF